MSQPPRLIAIHTGHSWNDLVVSQETHASVDEISKWIAEPKAGKRSREEQGLSVLFDGPPNTLKDIVAILIGKEAGWPVYRIDLPDIVSKFIGETEKNLMTVFEKADIKQSILFFDDADVLFGKRSDVNDAHDRFAVAKTFLKMLEQYGGIAIVAANIKNNIDDPFTRRFKVVVKIGGDE